MSQNVVNVTFYVLYNKKGLYNNFLFV